jgi:zinc protease
MWAHERSDLPVDPTVHYGALDNGLRYAWRTSDQDGGRCVLRLVVHVGSLDEAAQERGMAHFIAHVALAESASVRQRSAAVEPAGIDLAPHRNGTTDMEKSVYHFDLKDCSNRRMTQAMGVLTAIASEVEFSSEGIRQQIDILDAEDRKINDANFRLAKELLAKLYQGKNYADRLPIGDPGVRARFTDDDLRVFYSKWYRPDNMTLIAVGDLDGRHFEAEIAGHFENLDKGAVVEALGTKRGSLLRRNPTAMIRDSEARRLLVGFLETTDERQASFSADWYRKRKIGEVARLAYSVAVKAARRTASSSLYDITLVDRVEFDVHKVGVEVAIDPDRWREGLAAGLRVHHQVVECGLDARSYEEAIRIARGQVPGRQSKQSLETVARGLVLDAANKWPWLSQQALAELASAVYDGLTVDTLNAFLRQTWSTEKLKDRGLLVIGRPLDEATDSAVREAVRREVNATALCVHVERENGDPDRTSRRGLTLMDPTAPAGHGPQYR